MRRRERLATPEGKAATELGFLLGSVSVADGHFRDAFSVGYTNALRAHAAGTLATGGTAQAIADLIARLDEATSTKRRRR